MAARCTACRGAAFDVRAAHAVVPAVLQVTDAADTISIVDAYTRYAYDESGLGASSPSNGSPVSTGSQNSALERDINCTAYAALLRHGAQAHARVQLRTATAQFLYAAQTT